MCWDRKRCEHSRSLTSSLIVGQGGWDDTKNEQFLQKLDSNGDYCLCIFVSYRCVDDSRISCEEFVAYYMDQLPSNLLAFAGAIKEFEAAARYVRENRRDSELSKQQSEESTSCNQGAGTPTQNLGIADKEIDPSSKRSPLQVGRKMNSSSRERAALAAAEAVREKAELVAQRERAALEASMAAAQPASPACLDEASSGINQVSTTGSDQGLIARLEAELHAAKGKISSLELEVEALTEAMQQIHLDTSISGIIDDPPAAEPAVENTDCAALKEKIGHLEALLVQNESKYQDDICARRDAEQKLLEHIGTLEEDLDALGVELKLSEEYGLDLELKLSKAEDHADALQADVVRLDASVNDKYDGVDKNKLVKDVARLTADLQKSEHDRDEDQRASQQRIEQLEAEVAEMGDALRQYRETAEQQKTVLEAAEKGSIFRDQQSLAHEARSDSISNVPDNQREPNNKSMRLEEPHRALTLEQSSKADSLLSAAKSADEETAASSVTKAARYNELVVCICAF